MTSTNRSTSRRVDSASAGVAHEIYRGRSLIGRVSLTDAGWLGQLADETIVGTFPTEQVAIRAVFDADKAAS